MNNQKIIFCGILLAGLLLSCSAAAAPFAYISNSGNGTISIIDIADNSVVTNVIVGSSPRGVAVTPDGSMVYVTNYNNDTVSVINTTTNVITSVNVGDYPVGIAVTPDGFDVYVADSNWNAFHMIDTATNTLTQVNNVNTPWGVAVSPDGSKAYITNYWSSSTYKVFVINTTDNTVITNVPVGNSPRGVAVTPDGLKVYVANYDSNTVSVINTIDYSVSSVNVGTTPIGVAVTPDGSKVYVVNQNSNSVSVINTATDTVTATITGFNTPVTFGQFIRLPDATAAPVITTPVYAGATSVSGTAATGAKIVIRYNGVRQAGVTATGGAWTVPVPALATTDTISVTAWMSPNRMSAPVTATVVTPPAPTVTGISPSSGPVAGGTSVVITGTSLAGATAVKFGSANAATFTVNNATHITATSPAGTAGDTVHITVTTSGGTSSTSSADTFTYAGIPKVTTVSPSSGSTDGGTTVTITGTNLSYPTSVLFGSASAAITANSSTSITATSPAGSAGTVHITVITAGGTSATSSADQFTYSTPTSSHGSHHVHHSSSAGAADDGYTGPQPTVMGYSAPSPAPASPPQGSSAVTGQKFVPATAVQGVTSATAQNSSSFPLAPIVVGAAAIILVGGTFLVRRWWIRRQNPALFGK